MRPYRVVLIEPGSPGLPGRLTRMALHRAAESESGRTVAIFLDAAGTREVWAWRRSFPFAAPVYTEEHRAPDSTPFVPGPDPSLRVPDPSSARVDACAARRILLERLRRVPRLGAELRLHRAGGPAMRLRDLVEHSKSADVPRLVWGELVRTRIGHRSAGALWALAGVGAACLSRMQDWLEGARGARFSDFRRLLTRSREMAPAGGRDRFVLETVQLRCLRPPALVPPDALDRAEERLIHMRLALGLPEAELREGMREIQWRRQRRS